MFASFEVLQIVWLGLAAVDLLKFVSWGDLFLILLIILIHFEGRGRFNKLHLIVRVEISRNLLGNACLRIVVQRSAYLLTSVNGRLGVFGFLYWVDRSNPNGPPPANPGNDPQYLYWDIPVRNWLATHGITGNSGQTITAPPATPTQ